MDEGSGRSTWAHSRRRKGGALQAFSVNDVPPFSNSIEGGASGVGHHRARGAAGPEELPGVDAILADVLSDGERYEESRRTQKDLDEEFSKLLLTWSPSTPSRSTHNGSGSSSSAFSSSEVERKSFVSAGGEQPHQESFSSRVVWEQENREALDAAVAAKYGRMNAAESRRSELNTADVDNTVKRVQAKITIVRAMRQEFLDADFWPDARINSDHDRENETAGLRSQISGSP